MTLLGNGSRTEIPFTSRVVWDRRSALLKSGRIDANLPVGQQLAEVAVLERVESAPLPNPAIVPERMRV